MAISFSIFTALKSATTTGRGGYLGWINTGASGNNFQQIYQVNTPVYTTSDSTYTNAYCTGTSNTDSYAVTGSGNRYFVPTGVFNTDTGVSAAATNSPTTYNRPNWVYEGEPWVQFIFGFQGGADTTSIPAFDNFRISTANYDITYGFEASVTITAASGSGTIITCASTVGIQPGYLMGPISGGTGTFASGTYVKGVISQTQFVISAAPSVALSGATCTALGEWAPGGTASNSTNQITFATSTTGTNGIYPRSMIMPVGGGGSTGSGTGVGVTGAWRNNGAGNYDGTVSTVTNSTIFNTSAAPTVTLSSTPLIVNNCYLNWATNSTNASGPSTGLPLLLGQGIYMTVNASTASTTVVNATNTTIYLFPGMSLFQVTGTGLVAGTYVTSIVNGTTFTVNQNNTFSASSVLIAYFGSNNEFRSKLNWAIGAAATNYNTINYQNGNGPTTGIGGGVSRYIQGYASATSAYYWLYSPAFPGYASPYLDNYSNNYLNNLYPPYSYMKYANRTTSTNIAATVTTTYSSGGASGANTFVVSSATGIAIGQYVSGTGITTYNQVTNVVGSTITLSTNLTTQAAGTYTFYNWQPLMMPTWVQTPAYSIANAITNGSQTTTTITVTSIPQGLQIGAPIIVASGGTGSFPAGTVVTAINTSTTFTVSNAPSVTITTGQTLLFASTNTNNGLPPGLSLDTSAGNLTGTLDISTMSAGLNSYYFCLRCDFNIGRPTGYLATQYYANSGDTDQVFPGSNTGNFVFEVQNTSSALTSTVVNPINDMAAQSTVTPYAPSTSVGATLNSVSMPNTDVTSTIINPTSTDPKRTSVIVIG